LHLHADLLVAAHIEELARRALPPSIGGGYDVG
jgi:hypothetical protein